MPFTYDYPHMAVTADAVVLTRGAPPKVLLIQRARPLAQENCQAVARLFL